MMRRAARKDSTQSEIVSGLRAAGYTVIPIGQPVDLLVGVLGDYGRRWWWYLLEVKAKSGLRRKDQPTQNLFIDAHKIPVVSTLEEALEALK
jgi:hypothetical protein